MNDLSQSDVLDDAEIKILLEAVYRHYGYDFRNYAFSSLRRRIRDRIRAEQVKTISDLKQKVLHDPRCMERLLAGLSINVSAMFRDPGFYLSLRQNVIPLLKTYPFIRIWHAGCSTGEEVYSMAILLQEEGLYERSRIYATDMNGTVLKQAKEGIYPLAAMKQFTANYLQAGGQSSFSEYYTARYEHALFRASLKQNVVFAHHNLVLDGPFNEFHVIVCRNVMIYFDKTLQERVNRLFLQSLVRFGFLCLGSKESLRYLPVEHAYREFDAHCKIYRRVD